MSCGRFSCGFGPWVDTELFCFFSYVFSCFHKHRTEGVFCVASVEEVLEEVSSDLFETGDVCVLPVISLECAIDEAF